MRWHDLFGMCLRRFDPERGRTVWATTKAWCQAPAEEVPAPEADDGLPLCTKCKVRNHGDGPPR